MAKRQALKDTFGLCGLRRRQRDHGRFCDDLCRFSDRSPLSQCDRDSPRPRPLPD
ncbi:hypothetical protein [Streptomyces sp. NHF165]|uniref:hypothetical protein n=1 Tax=Streptomyces sp. NHF165 TaxID=2175864 RepID=UPI001F43B9D1|nr:hypothetical protein [Streptomyces sp. NHF165]